MPTVPRRNYLLIMDQLWKVLRVSEQMVYFIDSLTRLNRGRGMGQVLITHTMKDLDLSDEALTNIAWGFVFRSEMVFLGGLDADEMGNLRDVFDLSTTEVEHLTDWADKSAGIGTNQRRPHTIAAYRDSWRLLVTYIGETRKADIAAIDIGAINADLVTEFLTHLSADRHNSVSTRNARLTAIRAVLGYGLPYHPEHAETIRQVLSIEPHRRQRPIVSYLSTAEISALLASPNTATWTGRRDLMLLSLTIHTGLRASELLSLTLNSVHTGAGPHVTCQGKGRKNRATPLTPNIRDQLQAYLTERRRRPGDTLFPGPRGNQLSRDALERRLSLHVSTAAGQCPSIARKIVTMHTLRHTCAMRTCYTPESTFQ